MSRRWINYYFVKIPTEMYRKWKPRYTGSCCAWSGSVKLKHSELLLNCVSVCLTHRSSSEDSTASGPDMCGQDIGECHQDCACCPADFPSSSETSELHCRPEPHQIRYWALPHPRWTLAGEVEVPLARIRHQGRSLLQKSHPQRL